MRLLKSKALLGLIVASFATVSCTRKTSTDTSLHLDLSSIGAMDATGLQVVILNIQASGFQFFCQWNANGGSNSDGTLRPSSANSAGCASGLSNASSAGFDLNLSVPRGSGRLFQVLAVMGNNSGGTGDFLYADQTQDVTGDSMTVNLNVTSQGASGAGQSNIAGRYMNTSGSGPTGTISVYFQPVRADGTLPPKMLIDQSNEIFAGWFRVFAVQGTRFQYVVSDGTDLFNGATAIENVGIGTTSAAQNVQPSQTSLRVYVPPYFSEQNGSQGPPYSQQAADLSVYGFFGPGAAGKQICYYSIPEPITDLFADAAGSGNIQWNPNATALNGTDAFVVAVGGSQGGSATSSRDVNHLCLGSGARFVDYLSLDDQNISSNDSVLGFRGPFQLIPSTGGGGGNTIATSITGSTLTVNFTFLPGVQSTATTKGIDGVDIFARVEAAGGSSDDYRGDNDSVTCETLTTAYKFQSLGTQARNTDASGPALTMTASIPVTDTNLQSAISNNNASIVVCPFAMSGTTKKYFQSAGIMQPGNGGPQSVQTMFKLSAPGTTTGSTSYATSPNTQDINSCKLYTVTILDQSGNPYTVQSNTTVNFNFQGFPQTLSAWSDSGCSTTSIPNVTIMSAQSSASFYMKAPSVQAKASVQMFASSGNISGNSSAALFVVPTTPSGTGNVLEASVNSMAPTTTLVVGNCYPVTFDILDASFGVTTLSAATNAFTVTATGGGGGSFYTDGECQNPVAGQVSIPAFTAGLTIFYKPATPTASQNGSISISPLPSQITGSFASPASFWVDAPATAALVMSLQGSGNSAYAGTGNSWWEPYGCSQVQISKLSTNMGYVPTTGPSTTISLTTMTGKFYSIPACGGSATTTASFTLNSPNPNTLYYRSHGSMDSVTISGQSAQTLYIYPQIINMVATGNTIAQTGSAISVGVLMAARDDLGNPWVNPTGSPLPLNLMVATGTNIEVLAQPPPSSCNGGSASIGLSILPGASSAVGAVCAESIASIGTNNVTIQSALSIPGVGPSGPISQSIWSPMPAITLSTASSGGSPQTGITILAGTSPVSANTYNLTHAACEPLAIFPTDGQGYWSPANNTTLTPSGTALTNNTLFTDSQCSTGQITTAFTGYTTTTPYIQIYYRDNTQSATADVVTITSGASGTSNLVPQN